MRIGNAGRVSTRDQNPDFQHDALAARCEKILIDKASGKLERREQPKRSLARATDKNRR